MVLILTYVYPYYFSACKELVKTGRTLAVLRFIWVVILLVGVHTVMDGARRMLCLFRFVVSLCKYPHPSGKKSSTSISWAGLALFLY